jgi:hypothetical protein
MNAGLRPLAMEAAERQRLARRHRTARAWQTIFLAASTFGILGLTALLYNVVIDAFGLVAFQY